ncbi:MAG: hypothetical protein GX811_05640, partial [Lentisphaerae bacterium]|nr:hypothetical protein [Lentisphaerota bacterium]
MINRFFDQIFKFTKVATALIVLLCVIGIVISALFYIGSGARGVVVPRFKELTKPNADTITAQLDKEKMQADAALKEVEKRFGKEIHNIALTYKFHPE